MKLSTRRPGAQPRGPHPATIFALFLALVLQGCVMLGGSPDQPPQPSKPPGAAPQDRFADPAAGLTPRELMGLLMAFSDTYAERIAEAIDIARRADGITPDQRRLLQSAKVTYTTAAMGNATHLNPEAGLLDMVTMVSLQRMVWEGPSAKDFPWAGTERMTLALRKLEAEAWALAGRVFTPEQADDLRRLILDWRQKNPEQSYVAFIRFQDFGASAMKDALDELVVRGGLLAPVGDATRELHEARLLAERSLYLFKRLPLVVQLHGQLLAHEALALPETRGTLRDMERMTAAAERLQADLHRLPVEMTALRRDMLLDVADKIAAERAQLLQEADVLLARQRADLLAALDERSATLGKMVETTAVVTRDARETAALILEIAGPHMPRGPDEPTGLDKLRAIVDGSAVTTREARALLETLLRADATAAGRALADVDALFSRHERRLALLAAGLLALAAALGAGLLCAARWLRK